MAIKHKIAINVFDSGGRKANALRGADCWNVVFIPQKIGYADSAKSNSYYNEYG